ncbi:hypothetical protein P8A18_28425 [Streptomyces castrisilvae]|uniref:Integral membrane protein n=1 Tax=Streptomyces castrisilvae TaxID=3033811 RepID=A0ABY9HS34_9ACTN|nr:hypothetical protein [Streptomyces sp. Mut1]WLQ37121.1 hypothetical protein P8A18_28425 [Streptomyces sp. Mut1]
MLVLEKSSPLWWLFAAVGVALYLAVMFAGMVNRRQMIWVSCGPVAGFLATVAYSANYDQPLNELLPVYCGGILGIALGAVGHGKAMRDFMAWRAENPGKPDDEGPGVPWILQMAFTLPIFLGGAIWYMNAY